ncbi:Tao3p ASCRUDRAFT_28572, partial [Ascoidea rubescens DSM 1968]
IRREMATEMKKPSLLVLHILFTYFVRLAEKKLNSVSDFSNNTTTNNNNNNKFLNVLLEGRDLRFDKVIRSLGYFARQEPKRVLESVMYWKRSKEDEVQISAKVLEDLHTKLESVARKQNFSTPNEFPSTSNTSIKDNNNNTNLSTFSKLSRSNSKKLSKLSRKSLNHSRSTSFLSQSSNEIQSYDQSLSKLYHYYHREILTTKQILKNLEKKLVISNYILYRVMVEVVKQIPLSNSNNFDEDFEFNGLEENIYTELKSSSPIGPHTNPIKIANVNLLAIILGKISERRFSKVSDRFIANLENVSSFVADEEFENHIVLLIHGMKYLKLKSYPIKDFEDAAGFLSSVATFFERARNSGIILAYSEVLNQLILPLANVLTSETDDSSWKTAVTQMFFKGIYLLGPDKTINYNNNFSLSYPSVGINKFHQVKVWILYFNLVCTCLSLAPLEIFDRFWFMLISDNLGQLRKKTFSTLNFKNLSNYENLLYLKLCMVKNLSKLLWTYIFRSSQSLNQTTSKLSGIFDNLFFYTANPGEPPTGIKSTTVPANGKKMQWVIYDPKLINALVEMFRVVGSSYMSYVLEDVFIPLIKQSFNGYSLESLLQEKLIIILKAYVLMLNDTYNNAKPTFPSDMNYFLLDYSEDEENLNPNSMVYDIFGSKKIVNVEQDSTNRDLHEELSQYFAQLFILLDQQLGNEIIPDGEFEDQRDFINSSIISPLSAFSSFHFGGDSYANQLNKCLNLKLYENLINALPFWYIYANSNLMTLSLKKLFEILIKNCINKNLNIVKASVNVLNKSSSPKLSLSYFLMSTFTKIVFNFEYSNTLFSNSPNLNLNHLIFTSRSFQRLLKLYVELLNTWLGALSAVSKPKSVSKKPGGADYILNGNYKFNSSDKNNEVEKKSEDDKSADELEWKNIITLIEEVEGNGLFFLCSRNTQIRRLGLQILRLAPNFDQAIYEKTKGLKEPTEKKLIHVRSSSKFVADFGARLINVLHKINFFELIGPLYKELSMAEIKKLATLKTIPSDQTLERLAEADNGIELSLFFRVFPKVLNICFKKCPIAIALCRSIVCGRLVRLQEYVVKISQSSDSLGSSSSKHSLLLQNPKPEIVIQQWKMFLIVACCSLTSTSEQTVVLKSIEYQGHSRKKSQQTSGYQFQTITSAKSIFKMVISLLNTNQTMVRDSIIYGLSCVNINIYKVLIQTISPLRTSWEYEMQRKVINDADSRLKIEVSHVLASTSKFILDEKVYLDEWILRELVTFIKTLINFLLIEKVQESYEYQKLRRYFCVLLENFYLGLKKSEKYEDLLSFEARVSCFQFLEEWCGYGRNSLIADERYKKMMATVKTDTIKLSATLQLEQSSLQFASLSCMATLCSGPITEKIGDFNASPVMSFDVKGLLIWIKSLFSSKSFPSKKERKAERDLIHALGRRALRNLLMNDNKGEILETVIKECYNYHESPMPFENYFFTIAETIISNKDYKYKSYEVLFLALFAIGSSNYEVRRKAGHLLKTVEKRVYNTEFAKTQMKFICSKSIVLYKRAMFNLASLYSVNFPEDKYYIISLLCYYFQKVGSPERKDILSLLLSWVPTVALKIEDDDLIKDLSTLMVLNNLFEITIKFSDTMYTEVDALWSALANVTPSDNIRVILAYVISESLKRRNSTFVEYARQIVVSVSSLANNAVIEKLVSFIEPKTMIPPAPEINSPIINNSYPYFYTLSNYKDKEIFSLGQISLIFLVDVFSSDSDMMKKKIPLLLHICFVLLDHYLILVQNQAKAMLANIVHELGHGHPDTDDLIELLMRNDHSNKNLWIYDDLNNPNGAETPQNMDSLIKRVLNIFSPAVPNLQEEWSKIALKWATTCAVRHMACRSFQVFRSLFLVLDQPMLRELLHRLSNTISDTIPDIINFALQIFITLNTIVEKIDPDELIVFPQLFWAIVACLTTINEQEFEEGLSILNNFLAKIDLDSEDSIDCLIRTFPENWEGKFSGLQQLVTVGLRSSNTWNLSLKLFDRLNEFIPSEIIGGKSRLLLAVLINIPRFMHAYQENDYPNDVIHASDVLSKMANSDDKPALARIFISFSKKRFRTKMDFVNQTISLIRQYYFPEFQAQALVFLMGFLLNKVKYIKMETMIFLKELVPYVDLTSPDFIGAGADLISPLLRLLMTEYSDEAFKVLEKFSSISGNEFDKEILKSILGTKNVKEYERAVTLFGIPEESGWSIPMPEIAASTTRTNVLIVSTKCVDDDYDDATENENQAENIMFHEDYNNANLNNLEPTTTDNVSVGLGDYNDGSSLTGMWVTLNYFDTVFTRDIPEPGPLPELPELPEDDFYNSAGTNEIEEMNINQYEALDPMSYHNYSNSTDTAKISSIVNRSLARTDSNTSFR